MSTSHSQVVASGSKQAPSIPKSSNAKSSASQALTSDQGEEILSELRQIRQLLENASQRMPNTSRSQKITLRVDPKRQMLGEKGAPVTIVEFTDLECPFCKRAHSEIFSTLKKDYIDTGKVCFVSVDLPLSAHAHAFRAAEAVRCAGEQEKFWELRNEVLSSHEVTSSEDSFLRLGAGLGLDLESFKLCMASKKYDEAIKMDVKSASSLEIHGTPTFVIAPTSQAALQGVRITGAVPFSVIQTQIEEVLKQSNAR